MVPLEDGPRWSGEVSSPMEIVFALADEVYQGLGNVRPRLSLDQLEQVGDILLHRLLQHRVNDVGWTLNDNLLQDACRELLTRMDSNSPSAWTRFVVRTLCLLNAKAGLDCERLVVHVWRIVAQPAEEMYGGVGAVILRACVDSFAAEKTLTLDNLKALMDVVIVSLRNNGDPPVPVTPVSSIHVRTEANTAVLTPSPAGLRLAFEVASHTLAMLKGGALQAEGSRPPLDFDDTGDPSMVWRWHLHVEVVRLLRVCRSEDVRKQLVLTMARPLYRGWGHPGALEDVWSFIASADEETVELHLALLCILAEDLLKILDLPARRLHQLWNLVFLGISNKSDLCRRRALHVLQLVLSWVDGLGSLECEGLGIKSSPGPTGIKATTKGMFSREELLRWKDYARVLKVLEMETEMHLLDQVVPTVVRLCSMLSPAGSDSHAPPSATEFRWIGIPLRVLVTTGTVARRRSFIYRLVTRDLGIGKRADGGGGGFDVDGGDALAHMDETWVVQVLLPALEHVGWHSSTARGTLRHLSESVADFLRSYVQTLSISRVTIFLTLLLKAIKERAIGSPGALCAILAAFDLGRTKVPAMGAGTLLELKDMLLVVLPPLNQAKRILLLDGVIHILGAFTDYAKLGRLSSTLESQPLAGRPEERRHELLGEQDPSFPLLNLVAATLSAIPGDLAKERYLPQLASWVASLFWGRSDSPVMQGAEEHTLWIEIYKKRMERYLRQDVVPKTGNVEELGAKAGSSRLVRGDDEGRSLCLLGLVLSEGFSRENERDQVLANGLSPLVKVLQQCWRNPYIATETVHAALILFSAWAAVCDGMEETRRWRWSPLKACVDEVVTLVTARLVSLIEAASNARCRNSNGNTVVDGSDARVLLNALSVATTHIDSAACGAEGHRTNSTPAFHPGVIALRVGCVSLLIQCRGSPLPPAAHLMTIACLEIIIRSQSRTTNPIVSSTEVREFGCDEPRPVSEDFSMADAEQVIISLLQTNVQGRIASRDGSIGQGSDSEWDEISRGHELRKWSCLSLLLPLVLGEARAANNVMTREPSVCDALVDGIQACLREEMPMAMACFRIVFPRYVHLLPQNERAFGFTRVFELVWDAFKEVRRPQLPLVRDMISAVLHPVNFAMPELNGREALDKDKPARGSCLVDAFNSILDFGSANKPNVLRALVGGLTTLWRQSPGSIPNLVPGIVQLLLFKEWGHGIETMSNDEASSASEAPRLMLLLFIENWLIPSAASGDQDCRQILRALTMHLMELQTSKEFRQGSITDPIIYGRKLRAWQALCVLCGYLCDATLSTEDAHVSEIIGPIAKWFWPVHGRTALPTVRHHMEIFAVRMCKSYPDVFLAAAIKELADFRLPGQVLCSLLIVAGHTLVGKESIASPHHRLNLFKACLPWMVGTHVMGRMIAQLVCHSLLPEAVDNTKIPYLEGLFGFLHDNADMVKMRQRQLETFSQTDCVAMCTVQGMLQDRDTGSNSDITPTHMCELIQETMDEIWDEALDNKHGTLEEGRAWLQTAAEVNKGTWFEEDEGTPQHVDNHIQQKIIPWDKLDLTVDMANSASLEKSTAAGKTRQSVVMCATLVDKVPNLAGLARTCEIFAASRLIVPDLRVIKNPSFSKISTGAEQWLPIEELGDKQLLTWIRRVKEQGYTLVGIEQTNNSVCLTKMKFAKRCILVLGRENSGLPLPVIQLMDFCCQIPQQGVLRSLNAHVSGSLVLWEYTRQMLLSAP